ncbi:bromodomain-containing protein [Histoplasma capsulatum H143]|uniref:SAGA complex subunit Spt7 n=1 Tax=Ajellomyces capsulatus (strain H143) TaxID=544712 RepID=C6HRD6_AJECH|nr:bromodomain-containing protein [Histoplasma capsulatum H143]
MSIGQHHNWLLPGHLRPPDDHHDPHPSINGLSKVPSRPRTPQLRFRGIADGSQSGNMISDADTIPEEDPRIASFRDCYQKGEAKISALFNFGKASDPGNNEPGAIQGAEETGIAADGQVQSSAPARKAARKLDEDDYDDYDDDDESESAPPAPSPLIISKPAPARSEPNTLPSPPQKPSIALKTSETQKDPKKHSLEDIRKKLEEDKKATEEAARRNFHTVFYTLENDRDAMLDQQMLEESERQVEAEMSGQGANSANSANATTSGHGTLSSANLGASSLTLKNLIARIDMKRSEVQASDAELRSLMSEVRKNRSKWASEEKVGQEELYEAAEKVLSELKAMTEHSSAFLTRVNKREAPDYYNIIKRPMDLGTMTKKLKAVQYKSKQEFVEDLNLIWTNCLKYNANPEHFLRKHALYMRKETEKLVPLIPDIVIRDRAEVEAEERRLQLAELDGAEESDDEPIMSSRGRKAPGMKSKKGIGTGRTAPGSRPEATPGAENKTQGGTAVGAESDTALEGSQNGFSTPPPGTLTPLGSNGLGPGAAGSQGDAMDIDAFGVPVNSSALSRPMIEFEDPEYKIWKQVTKKDRALLAAERHRLFKGDKLNADEPALLRSKAGMRRWLRNQRPATEEADRLDIAGPQSKEVETTGETLAEGIEVEEDKMLPDYYDTMSGIPDLPEQLRWIEDSEGNVVDHSEEFLRILPKGYFTSPKSKFSKKMDANMRQMQETRKVCSKIGIVKQMQLQSQMYQNQFQKYNPEPFVEQDVPTHVMNDDGPVISPWVCRAALQRSVGKIFYNAGFEEYQPSALDAVTDVAADFFYKIGSTLKTYMESPKIPRTEQSTVSSEWKSPYMAEEMILHTLQSVGTDVESLESYVKEDVDRLGQKLSIIHERMKSHLTELLRPAFSDTTGDGSSAFNDGSEQFVGGDFAEDIDEDFFGFKELGLDKEFGLASLSVPLHLLQNRMYSAHQAQNTSSSQASAALFPPPPPYPRISLQTLPSQIGLVQNFFLAKLHANNDEPLVEDLELPPKQRPTAARPRVPASGKIPHAPLGTGLNSSPQKRPAPPAGTGGSKPGAPEPSKKKSKKNNGTAGPSNAELGNDESSNQTKSSTSAKTLGKQKVSSTVADDKAAVISPKKSRHESSADGVVAESDSEIILSANNGNNDIKMNGSTSATVNGADPPDLAVGGSSAISGGGILSPESMSTR